MRWLEVSGSKRKIKDIDAVNETNGVLLSLFLCFSRSSS